MQGEGQEPRTAARVTTLCAQLMLGARRPIPSEDHGIGQWMWALRLTMAMAVPVVAGMIVLATGQVRTHAPPVLSVVQF